MLRTVQQLEHFNQEPWIAGQAHAFLAEKIPPDINFRAVKALCLEDVFYRETNFTDIPESLHLFSNLEYLRLPKKYIPQLRQGDIPDSVRVLEIIGEGTVTFPGKLAFPQVERLAGIPTALKFTRYNFPHLRHLTLRLDSRRTMLPVLAQLDRLETLGISPNHDGAVFEALAGTHLTVLALGSGQIRTLDGLERLQSLVAVRVTNMDKLENIESLVKLPGLAEVEISWCANLSNYEALLALPALEHLSIFGCKKFDPNKYEAKLKSLPLKTLSYPGRRGSKTT